MSVSTALFSFIALFLCSEVQCCEISYPVALDSLGPRPCPLPVLGMVSTTPMIEKPVIQLPAVIPCPQTVSNKCRCLKSIVKPQVIQQIINVPTLQRYIETSHRPVVEKIHYSAYPVNAGVRDIYGHNHFYDDGQYDPCCCCCVQEDVCTLPVAASMPVTATVPVAAAMPVNTAVPVAASLPVRRRYPVAGSCYQTCA